MNISLMPDWGHWFSSDSQLALCTQLSVVISFYSAVMSSFISSGWFLYVLPFYPSAPFHDTLMPVNFVLILQWKGSPRASPGVPGSSLGKKFIVLVLLSHEHPNYNSGKHFPNLVHDVTSFIDQISWLLKWLHQLFLYISSIWIVIVYCSGSNLDCNLC